jgi:hypothetical protein
MIRFTDELLVLIRAEELLRSAEREHAIRMVTTGQSNRLMDYLDPIPAWLRNYLESVPTWLRNGTQK